MVPARFPLNLQLPSFLTSARSHANAMGGALLYGIARPKGPLGAAADDRINAPCAHLFRPVPASPVAAGEAGEAGGWGGGEARGLCVHLARAHPSSSLR